MGIHSPLADVTIPFDFGLPQVFVLLIGLCGVGLLAWVATEIARGKRDKDGIRRRRRFGYGRAISGSLLLLVAISLLYLAIILQSYLGLTSEILVARVRATALANVPNYMSVELTLYDQHGNVTTHETDGVCGDRWLLQGDIVRFPGWLNILGLHTGYKLTRLEGQYSDTTQESTWYKTVVPLNGGDDNFFQTIQNQGGWLHPFVEASYGNAIILPADGNTYNVYVSQTGLTTRGPTSLAGHAPLHTSTALGLHNGSGPTDCRQLR
ncbi:MAG TPA: hypothetical protein VH599_16660 [Ktedonobacterales bacterium]|jgi:hypothetical protein